MDPVMRVLTTSLLAAVLSMLSWGGPVRDMIAVTTVGSVAVLGVCALGLRAER